MASRSGGPSTPSAPDRGRVPKPALASTHDWRTRTYDTLHRTEKQGRWLRRLRILLPVAAVLMIGFAVAWPTLFSQPKVGAPHMTLHDAELPAGNDVRMVNPRYAGVDSAGRAFLITAKRAMQDPNNEDLVHLSGVQADLTLKGGPLTHGEVWTSALSPTGLYNTNAQTLDLQSGTDVYSNTGYELHSPLLRLDLQNSLAMGEQGVEGHGPLGFLQADRYRLAGDERHLELVGHVRVRYDKGFSR